MSRKRIASLLLWLVAIGLVGVLTYSFVLLRGESRYIVQPNRTRVIVKGSERGFLDSDDIAKILPIDLSDTTTIAVQLAEIEQMVQSEIPYAKTVNAFVSPTHHQMTIEVKSRKPTLRYFTNQGSFFLDDEGHSMHTKVGISVHLPVVRAGTVDSVTLQQTLIPLGQFMEKHSEWANFFSVIELKEGNRLHLYPRIGDYIFEVLGANNLETELPKIHIFYSKIVPQVGANRYQLIKLSYEGQIVCKLRG